MLAALSLPAPLETRPGVVTLRRASTEDVDALAELLADDPFSASRGDVAAASDRQVYLHALQEILREPSNELLIGVDTTGVPVAMMQLTRIPGMGRRGTTRLLIEAVHVRTDRRSSGIGGAMMRWATGQAAASLGVGLVELTSDAARADAHRFYERLGFAPSHVGFKYRTR